jgi:hypothetical protein
MLQALLQKANDAGCRRYRIETKPRTDIAFNRQAGICCIQPDQSIRESART